MNSPCFLLYHKQKGKVAKILKQFAVKLGDVSAEPVAANFDEDQSDDDDEEEAEKGANSDY